MLSATHPAHAQLDCETPQVGTFLQSPDFVEAGDPESGVIQFEAGFVDAQLAPQASASMGGGVVVRSGSKLAGADNA